jgi:ubiquinone/menaquinone biosynthesis C-methylase UbiE
MHKFNPANKDKLDNPWRRSVLPPEGTLKLLGLKKEDILADIGCGIGYFTIPAAKILDNDNKIYALDILEEMLYDVEVQKKELKIWNIVTVKTEEYDLKLANDSITFALLGSVFHEIEDKSRFLKEIQRVLKPGGRLAIIEWQKQKMDVGPPIHDRLDKGEIIQILESSGMTLKNQMDFSDAFYGVISTK